MAIDVLDELRAAFTFDPSPVPADLASLHVPYDDLLSEAVMEGVLRDAIARGERVAVQGPSGKGKSSVVASAFELGSGFAPVTVQVVDEPVDQVATRGGFARHCAELITEWARATETVRAKDADGLQRLLVDRRELPSRQRGIKFGVKVARWIAEAGIEGELAKTLPGGSYDRGQHDYIAALEAALELVKSADRVPVIVVDDSDRWLMDGSTPMEGAIATFLDGAIRMLNEIGSPFVFAVHPTWADLDAWSRSSGIVSTTLEVPSLDNADQLAEILSRRIDMAIEVDLAAVFSEEAVGALFNLYRTRFNCLLRPTISVAHRSLNLARALPLSAEQIDASGAEEPVPLHP